MKKLAILSLCIASLIAGCQTTPNNGPSISSSMTAAKASVGSLSGVVTSQCVRSLGNPPVLTTTIPEPCALLLEIRDLEYYERIREATAKLPNQWIKPKCEVDGCPWFRLMLDLDHGGLRGQLGELLLPADVISPQIQLEQAIRSQQSLKAYEEVLENRITSLKTLTQK